MTRFSLHCRTPHALSPLLDDEFDDSRYIMERLVATYMLPPADYDTQEYQSKLMDRWADRRVVR